MLNQAFGSVIDHSWIPLSAWRRLHFPEQTSEPKLEPKWLTQSKLDFLDDVPVMAATVLALDMLLHEPCIDLQRAAELILSDVGATIHILLLIGREYDFTAQRLSRMGDCLASLDVGTWYGAISAARTFPCDREHAATTAVWKHCRLVAQYAQLVAESLEGVYPEDAYLVGLLHETEAIPAVLGWPEGSPVAGDLCLMERSLPLFVLAATRIVNDSCPSSTWRFILTEAHELAGATTEFDASLLLPSGLASHSETCVADEQTSHQVSLVSH